MDIGTFCRCLIVVFFLIIVITGSCFYQGNFVHSKGFCESIFDFMLPLAKQFTVADSLYTKINQGSNQEKPKHINDLE